MSGDENSESLFETETGDGKLRLELRGIQCQELSVIRKGRGYGSCDVKYVYSCIW